MKFPFFLMITGVSGALWLYFTYALGTEVVLVIAATAFVLAVLRKELL